MVKFCQSCLLQVRWRPQGLALSGLSSPRLSLSGLSGLSLVWRMATLGFCLGTLAGCMVPVELADPSIDSGGTSVDPMPVDPAPADPVPAEPSPVDPASLLPPLSPAEQAQHRADMDLWIQSDMDLIGLGKLGQVGWPLAAELEDFRQEWAAVDPAIAPFLGKWVRDWNMMPHVYLTVLPSRVPGQVCLVRYRQQETETVPFEVITTPLTVSVALVIDGQLRSADVQSAEDWIQITPASAYVAYPIEFLATVEGDRLELYASQQPPRVESSWEMSLRQTLASYQCTDGLPRP